MASTPNRTDSAVTELVVKTLAPRAPQHLLARPRLAAADAYFGARQIALVAAPAGFGKTSLLT
jgi:LuxR family maltose regulon positive regulatory protein